MKLAEIQRRFQTALIQNDLDGIRNEIANKTDQRMVVYQTSYENRLFESLRDDFLELQSAVGEREFQELLQTFIANHPSRSATLFGYSEQFVRCLIEQNSPLAHLAIREWAGLRVRQRVETSFLELSADQIQTRIHELTLQRNRASELVHDDHQGAFVLVWKKLGDVFELEISAEEARVLELTPFSRTNLVEWANRVMQSGISGETLKSILSEWTRDKIIGMVE